MLNNVITDIWCKTSLVYQKTTSASYTPPRPQLLYRCCGPTSNAICIIGKSKGGGGVGEVRVGTFLRLQTCTGSIQVEPTRELTSHCMPSVAHLTKYDTRIISVAVFKKLIVQNEAALLVWRMKQVQVMKNNMKSCGEIFAHTLQQYCYFEMAEKKMWIGGLCLD